MQPRPTAAELLAAVVPVLEQEVVSALTGPAQHHARVAASLVAIVERELRLAEAAADREHAALQDLLGRDEPDLRALRALLTQALRSGMADDDATAARVWPVLMALTRDDLAIAKPGHDTWEGS